MFRIVVLPDTQHYAVSEESAAVLRSQCRWINGHAQQLSIVLVLHLGDVVDDFADDAQWARARSALGTLTVPYVLAAGNHDLIDYPPGRPSAYCGTAQYDRFFPLDHFSRMPTFHSALGSSGANSAHVVAVDGLELLVVTVEFGPSDEQLSWAKGVFAAHPDRIGVLVTHDYLGDDDQLRGARTRDAEHSRAGLIEEFALPNGAGGTRMAWANTGVQIWEKLVRDCPSLRLVLNGHVCTHEARVSAPGGWTTIPRSPYAPSIAGRRTTFRAEGPPVYELLSNYQSMPQGGLGYLRVMEIDSARGRVGVSTYSPYLDESLDNPDDRFCLAGVDLTASRDQVAADGAEAHLNDLRRLASLGLLVKAPRMLSHPEQCPSGEELGRVTQAVTSHALGDGTTVPGAPFAASDGRAGGRAQDDQGSVTRAVLAHWCADLLRRCGTPGRVAAGYLDAIDSFDDMPEDRQAAAEIIMLRGLGILGGWADNTARLDRSVTGGEAAALLSRTLTACGR